MLLAVAQMIVMMAVMMRQFLRRRRRRRRLSPACRPRLEEAGCVGLGGPRRQLGVRRCQQRRVHLHVECGETFAEDRIVRLEVNVQTRTA